MGTGSWANFHWENGIWVTATGNLPQINNRDRDLENQKNNRLGNGIWAKFGLANGILYPLRDPLPNTEKYHDAIKHSV